MIPVSGLSNFHLARPAVAQASRSSAVAFGLALLGVLPGSGHTQEGITISGWGESQVLPANTLDSLSRDAVRVTPGGQPAEAHVGAALDRLLARAGRRVMPDEVRGPRWARDVVRIDVRRLAGPSDDTRLVVLVRHAEKADQPRADPPLTEAGRARAEALVAATDAAGIGAVVVTPFARTRATAAPLAQARGLTPIEIPVGRSVAEHVAAVVDAVRARPAGEAVLVVGHSNTIPAIVTALGGPALPDLCDSQYSVLYVMTVPPEGPARLVTASYGAADPPGAGCPAMR